MRTCDSSASIVFSCSIVPPNLSIGEDTFICHQVLIVGDPNPKITIVSNVDITTSCVVILSVTY